MYKRTPSFRASILDRLMDDLPQITTESVSEIHLDISRFKQAVARDLESLLNSRRVDFEERIESMPQARRSILTYGITDLSSLSLLDQGAQGYLRTQIKAAIERNEPRLSRVRVSLDAPKGRDRQLRFRVDAVLTVHRPRVHSRYSIETGNSSSPRNLAFA